MNDWPLVLAGPIVRHVQLDVATVWVALSEERTVRLDLWNGRLDTGGTSGLANGLPSPLATASADTVRVGAKLHVAVVSVELTGGQVLQEGTLYAYNLTFTDSGGAAEDLRSLGLLVDGDLKRADGTALPGRPNLALGYDAGFLPAFATPAEDLTELRVAHASCRKLHGNGPDMLPHVDDLIREHRQDATLRPQQLFLTGDQIYADDVAPMVLPAVHAAGSALLWGANSAGVPLEYERLRVDGEYLVADMRTLPSGWRFWPACFHGKFTPEGVARSHLMTFSEYCAMYLFAWSNAAWPVVDESGVLKTHPGETIQGEPGPDDMPDVFTGTTLSALGTVDWTHRGALERIMKPARFNDVLFEGPGDDEDLKKRHPYEYETTELRVLRDEIRFHTDIHGVVTEPPSPRIDSDVGGLEEVLLADLRKEWFHGQDANPDVAKVASFYDGLARVRRALANVATWMTFDDHDVTDDWNLSERWVVNNVESETGRAMIRNALMAYALFQGWGNDPDRWAEAGSDKRRLLQLAEVYGDAVSHPSSTSTAAAAVLTEVEDLLGLKLVGGKPAKSKVTWDYRVLGPRYTVFSLDGRTRRHYPSPDAPPFVLPPDEVRRQIPGQPRPEDELVFVISPLPVFGHPGFEAFFHPFAVRLTAAGATRAYLKSPNEEIERTLNPGGASAEAEHWPLQIRAREFLLKHVAKFGRVVFLSGEVHFGASLALDYWKRDASLPPPTPAELAGLEPGERDALHLARLEPEARCVQLISSGLRNAEPEPIVAAMSTGAGQWALAHSMFFISGEDGFASGLSLPPTPDGEPPDGTDPELVGVPMVLYGWEDPHATVELEPGELVPLHHRPGILATPATASNRGWPSSTDLAAAPDWGWLSRSVADLRPRADRGGPAPPLDPLGFPGDLGDRYALALQHHGQHAGQDLPRRFSYFNHFGVVRFSGDAADRRLRHQLYTVVPGEADARAYLEHETRLKLTDGALPVLQRLEPAADPGPQAAGTA